MLVAANDTLKTRYAIPTNVIRDLVLLALARMIILMPVSSLIVDNYDVFRA